MNLYLSGMIGSGKTVLGTLLAQRLGWSFFDLDQEMDKELSSRGDHAKRVTGRPYTFHDLVREQGWLAFRELEYNLCKRFSKMNRSVIALGGGTARYEWNRDILMGTGVRILLLADLKVLAERVSQQDRPRVNPGTTLVEDLKRIWDEHQEQYLGFGDLHHRTDEGKTVSEEVQDLLGKLRRGKWVQE